MLIREATPDDAEQIIAYVHQLDAEPNSMIPRAPGEFRITAEQERELLAEYEASNNSIYIVAEMNYRIVGILSCEGGKRQATKHNASFGMSVAKEQRNCGVGTALLAHLVSWSKATGVIHRLELEVYAHNASAIHLYRKFDFVEEGRRRSAYFQHNRWIDALIMARHL